MDKPAYTGRFPATGQGVELAVVWAFLGIRAFDLLQGTVALAAGSLRKSSDPVLDIGLFITVAAESLLLSRWLLKRGSTRSSRWPIALDFTLSACVVASAPAYIPSAARLDTWTMWAYPVTLSTIVLLAVAFARPMPVLITSGTLAIIYLGVVALPLDTNVGARSTALVNALAFPGFAMVAFL